MTHGKLGKLAPKDDKRTLRFADYLNTGKLPPIPTQKDWSGKVRNWGMMGNDTLGDCTCAAAGHLIEEWSANASTEIVPSDTDIISAYSAVSGYDPATGENDNGAYELDVLNYWRKTGIANRKIFAYAACEPKNHAHIKAAVYLFGGCYLGVALPLSAQSQRIWSVTRGPDAAPGSWGGHAIPVVSYNQHTLTVVTWGQLQEMTWGFLDRYTDESYAILSEDFISNGIAPNAINWTDLEADLGKVVH